MNFLKMEGLGNDFIITHEIDPGAFDPTVGAKKLLPTLCAELCDRRRGIGADGVILILRSAKADFAMRIFNSDGSEAEMCGNGIRCCALYVRTMQLSDKQPLTFETGAGPISTELLEGGLVRVNMGPPILDAPKIPTAKSSCRVIMHELQVDCNSFKVTAVSMGNPHAVIYVDEITDDLVHHWGKKIENHPFFPKKTNVEFIKVLSNNEIQMRVWERGCGETQACGTGACAAAVSGIINHLHDNRVTVHLLGGDLLIEWDGSEASPVFMTGPAKIAFRGSVEIGG
jgi:diaminopimelate epimerase